MGSIDVHQLQCVVPTGEVLFDDVSFRVGEGEHIALVGANGVGKTTLLRQIAEGGQPSSGSINVTGSLAFMNQMIGMRDSQTVRDLYLSLSPGRYQSVAQRLALAEAKLVAEQTDVAGVKYANALAEWETVGGYELEVHWAECADRAVGLDWSKLADRATTTFSGGEQKRLGLELL